jgi:hypothetical protein
MKLMIIDKEIKIIVVNDVNKNDQHANACRHISGVTHQVQVCVVCPLCLSVLRSYR